MTTDPRAVPAIPDAPPGTVWSEWTVILLKPDCLARHLTGPVLAMVSQHVRVTARRTLYPTQDQVFTHYADILPLSAQLGVNVAAELRRIYLGHPVTVALGHGPDAAARLRALITRTWPDGTTLTELLDIAAIDPATPSPAKTNQTALF